MSATTGLIGLCIAIALNRGLGQSVLSMVSLALVGKWFARRLNCAMGISGGVVTVIFFSVWGQAFGRSHLGRIQVCPQMLTVFASAVGPLLLAGTLRQTGSYDLMFNSLAVVVVFLGVASWYAPLPSREVTFRAIPFSYPAGETSS